MTECLETQDDFQWLKDVYGIDSLLEGYCFAIVNSETIECYRDNHYQCIPEIYVQNHKIEGQWINQKSLDKPKKKKTSQLKIFR